MHLFYFSNQGPPSQEAIKTLLDLHHQRLDQEWHILSRCGYANDELALYVLEGREKTSVYVMPLSVALEDKGFQDD